MRLTAPSGVITTHGQLASLHGSTRRPAAASVTCAGLRGLGTVTDRGTGARDKSSVNFGTP